jgi:molybdenum cofactor cytidylyltransferase
MGDIGLVLLAAGSSSRMGHPKQLLDYRGMPLVRHAATIGLASACRPVIVVLGSRAAQILPVLGGLAVEAVIHYRWADGIGSSIRAGVATAAERNVEGVILSLADQCRLTATSLDGLIAIHRETGRGIVASRYADTVGVPAFFARRFFPRLLALDPDEGCKRVLLEHVDESLYLDSPEAEADIDTPADYAAALEEPGGAVAAVRPGDTITGARAAPAANRLSQRRAISRIAGLSR